VIVCRPIIRRNSVVCVTSQGPKDDPVNLKHVALQCEIKQVCTRVKDEQLWLLYVCRWKTIYYHY
jgi:hypothetical protein